MNSIYYEECAENVIFEILFGTYDVKLLETGKNTYAKANAFFFKTFVSSSLSSFAYTTLYGKGFDSTEVKQLDFLSLDERYIAAPALHRDISNYIILALC